MTSDSKGLSLGLSLGYCIDDAAVTPEAFYAAACSVDRSVVVEACAGAGKTWMLVSRMVRALLAGAQPDQIVAITFTRKAAAEMRERLDDWLAEWAQADDASLQQALQQRGLTAPQAQDLLPQLRGLQGRLLAQGQAVEVHTFHAWFAQLLRAAPVDVLHRLGLAPELRLIEDASELSVALGRRFRRRVIQADALREAYFHLVRRHGLSKLRDWLDAALERRVELDLGAEAAGRSVPAPSSWQEDPIAAWSALRPLMEAAARGLGQGKATAQKVAAGLVDALLCDEAEAGFAAARAALFTSTGSVRKLPEASASAEWRDAVAAFEQLQADREQWWAHQDHQALLQLAQAQAQEFAALKRERGCIDMGDLELGACTLLGDPVQAGWLQQQLDLQVRHLLIDEFQDTSPLQWQALQAWLSAYAGSGSGAALSVFVVGDPKQSIYRFRRAEPRVFHAAADFVVQGLGGLRLSCDRTRRNAPAVLDCVNRVFEPLMRGGAFLGFRPHQGASQDPIGAVWTLDAPPAQAEGEEEMGEEAESAWRPSLEQARQGAEVQRRAAEGRRVAALVQDLLQRDALAPTDIMVLARKRDALAAVAAGLRERGIAHETPESQALIDCPEVLDLLAVLDVLASPGHDLALARVLRSALFGVDESALLGLQAAAAAAGQSWLTSLLALPPAQAQALGLARAQQLMGAWWQELRHACAFEALQRVLTEGEFKARVAARLSPAVLWPRWAAIDALLDQALNLDGGRYWSLYGFVRALRQRPLVVPVRAHGQGVQLLTIHGAKGLEADTVILVDADAAPARAQSSTLLIDWPVEAPGPTTVAFLASESRPPPQLQAAMDEEMAQRRREELNGLYVALTRARRQLVVSRTAALRGANSASAWSLLAHLPPWPHPLPEAQLAHALERPPLPCLPPPGPQSSGEPAARPQACGQAEDPRSAQLGEALHRVMEWATQPGAQRVELAQWLAAAAQMYGLDARAQQSLADWVKGLLGSEALAPFLDHAGLLWAGNEVGLVWQGQEIRLDRLVCRECQGRREGGREWWVLDYKLHPAPATVPEYQLQMERYVRAVQALEPADAVRGAFISADGRLHPWPAMETV
ncbi:UvrD-helicase domain-containing protein [Inhella inkyongensis]|uniref:UvrD-helicase domain-containing protein n=1 Tax=Inhella inkyongensis TaxID=392593 RepID=UPI001FE32352|nr:UvrD-helicase domain-containing protein [Inhella inkyongensis]